MIYDYDCKECNNEFQLFRKVDEMFDEMLCPECGGEGKKIMSCFRDRDSGKPLQKGIVLNDDLVTDFDGNGEKHYNRSEYKDKCKELGRQPVGLLF